MANAAKPTLARVEEMPRKKTTDARLTDMETALIEMGGRLGKLEEGLDGLIQFLTRAKGAWWFVHQGFAGLGYVATTAAAIFGAWKLFFAPH